MTTIANELEETARKVAGLEDATGYDWQAKHRDTWGKLSALREALDGGPSPMCRDCADGNGTCENDGLPCDPHQRSIEQIRRLRAAST